MANPWAAVVLAVAAAMAAAPATAQMFKCVDENGITHYTDKPPPGCRGSAVDIRPQPPISGKSAPRNEDFTRADRDFRNRQMDRERAEKEDARKREAQKRRCASLQAEYERFTSGRRIARTNEKGERIYMEDAEREQRAAKLKNDIAQGCPP